MLPFIVRLVAGLLLFAAPPALAAPQGGSHLRPDDHRVAEVAWRLAVRGAPFCPAPHPLTGLLLHHLPEYAPADRPAFVREHRLDRGPGILSVVADSPAAAAGLRAGDVLLAVNGAAFPSPAAMAAERDRRRWRPMVEASEAQLEAALQAGPARLTVLRGGESFETTLAPRPGCPMRIRLARSPQNNAFADGRYVVMTSALLAFLESDDELAAVLAHELAHNVLGHRQRLADQRVPRGLLRGFGRNGARVRATELEADRLSASLLWAAGYDLDAAPRLWRRYHASFGGGDPLFRTHPGLGTRERLWEEAKVALGSSRP
ncbi:MAG: M48 family metalloprotease [Allosphingosinicella sp.]|uniref:M48 family metallopeptidase n=1 Tax=Allosphingosinicella sp. TaxID=2823234 RepID=UPI003936BA46